VYPSRQDFQQFLLRLFPKSDPGHVFVKSQSYVLRNTMTDKYILPSSPGVKHLFDLIKPDDLVEMSVIIPYEEADAGICPKCNKRREATSLERTWYVACTLLSGGS
jgi:hypothetical protein